MAVKNYPYNTPPYTPQLLTSVLQQQDRLRLAKLHNAFQQLLEKHQQQQLEVESLKKRVQTQINILATLRQNRSKVVNKNIENNKQDFQASDQSSNFIETLALLMGKILPKALYEQKIAKIRNDSPLQSNSSSTPKLKVAAILDEFSFMSLSPDLELIQLKPDIYKQQIQKFN